MKIHELKQLCAEDNGSRAMKTTDIVRLSEKSNKTLHDYEEKESHRLEKVNKVLHQISSVMNEKKPFKAKKAQKKKNKKKKYRCNQANLEHMYAREQIFLQRLSLLKLKIQLIKRKKTWRR